MFTLPNSLTLARIALILPFAWLFFYDSIAARWVALALFLVAAATDWFDGYLARRLKQGSALGRMLDPIADKLLVATAVVALVATGGIAGWSIIPALAILLREIAVSGFREHLGQRGVVVPVSSLAKWKTTVQLVALGCLLAPVEWVQPWGIGLLWAAAMLTVITGWVYLRATLMASGSET
jgi:cardiolipin synthase